MYPKYEKPICIDCEQIDVWLIGQAFNDEAYYAILGREISLFRTLDCGDITEIETLEGHRKPAIEEWSRFAGKGTVRRVDVG